MSKTLCVYGNVLEKDTAWHEDGHIPAAAKRLGARAFYFEAGANPHETNQHATSLTLYEDVRPVSGSSIASQSLPLADSILSIPTDAVLEARSYATAWAHKKEDYSGDYADAGCLSITLLSSSRESQPETFAWWFDEVTPLIAASPLVYRARMWELAGAADLRGGVVTPRDGDPEVSTWVGAYEFESEDAMWAFWLEIGQSEGWTRFVEKGPEETKKYQFGFWKLKRVYGREGEVEFEFDGVLGADTDGDEEDV